MRLKGGIAEFKLPGLTKIQIMDKSEGRDYIMGVYKHRLLRSTEKNKASSRSHVIIDMKVVYSSPKNGVRESRLRFCDLAGSERFPKNSKAVDKMQIKEMASINVSLSSLGRLISGLNSGFDIKSLAR